MRAVGTPRLAANKQTRLFRVTKKRSLRPMGGQGNDRCSQWEDKETCDRIRDFSSLPATETHGIPYKGVFAELELLFEYIVELHTVHGY